MGRGIAQVVAASGRRVSLHDSAPRMGARAGDVRRRPAEAPNCPGFVASRPLMPCIDEAAYALMEGVAEREAIDTLAKLGIAHPFGRLSLAGLIGLDTCVASMEVLRH